MKVGKKNHILTCDVHTHIMPPSPPNFLKKYDERGSIILLEDIPDSCCRNMVSLDGAGNRKFFRKVEPNCFEAAPRLEECADHGVDMQVLSPIPVLFYYDLKPDHALATARFFNDHIAETVAGAPQRFIGLGTVPLQAPKLAIREMERCVTELGLKGVEIATNVNGMDLDHPDLFPFFEAAQSLGAAVFIHPWYMRGDETSMKDYWGSWLIDMPNETVIAVSRMVFGRVFARLPKLRVLFAHGGGNFLALAGRLTHGRVCRPDLFSADAPCEPKDFFNSFWVDSLTHDPDLLDLLVKKMGKERVALGSDYPFPLGELTNGHYPGKLIKSMPFDRDTKEWLLHRSAFTWLGLREREVTW